MNILQILAVGMAAYFIGGLVGINPEIACVVAMAACWLFTKEEAS